MISGNRPGVGVSQPEANERADIFDIRTKNGSVRTTLSGLYSDRARGTSALQYLLLVPLTLRHDLYLMTDFFSFGMPVFVFSEIVLAVFCDTLTDSRAGLALPARLNDINKF